MLAEFLATEAEIDLPTIYKRAFILGNIEPDKNLFTYLHGVVRGVKFHGHNYENILPVMEKLFYSLHSKIQWGVREYYHFGKLMHYVADTFTFPHNKIFTGNLKEHCRYEQELHEKFVRMLKNPQKQRIRQEKSDNCLNDIINLHEEYLHWAGNCETDCRYILRAAVMLAQEKTGIVWEVDFSRYENVAGEFV